MGSLDERDRPDATEAISRMAECLFETVERFDPSDPPVEWGGLNEFQQETWKLTVRHLLAVAEDSQIASARNWSPPGN